MTTKLPRHHSVTHIHLLACLNTMLMKKLGAEDGPAIRILDVGCGDGRLMSYLYLGLSALYPNRRIDIHGFDIMEQGWGVPDEYERAVAELTRINPEIPWRERLRLVSSRDAWPFSDGFFEATVSNMVLEHVEDIDHFLSSVRRVLKPDGVSLNLFPLANTVMEGHVKVPFAHWIRDIGFQRSWIRLWNRLGLGRWSRDRRLFGEQSLESYADSQASYLQCFTSYRTFGDLYAACRNHKMAVSHRYTRGFYEAKLRDVFKLPPRLSYSNGGVVGADTILFAVLRHISASTIVFEPVEYDVASRIHLEVAARRSEDGSLGIIAPAGDSGPSRSLMKQNRDGFRFRARMRCITPSSPRSLEPAPIRNPVLPSRGRAPAGWYEGVRMPAMDQIAASSAMMISVPDAFTSTSTSRPFTFPSNS